jgi:hypothetical protein
MVQTFFYEANRSDAAETEILVEYSISGGCAAQTYGPAELCYPAEASEVEIVNVCLAQGLDADGKNIPVALTDDEIESITQWIVENHEHDDGTDYDY